MAEIVPAGRNFLSDDFFGDVFKDFGKDGSFRTDVKETAAAFVVQADLPGFTKEEIQVDYANDVLTIHAEHTEKNEDSSGEYLRKERTTTSQHRQFMIRNVDEDKIKAAYTEGVLTIDLPKTAENNLTKKRITID